MKWGKHRRYGKRRRSRLFCILYILYPLLLCLCLGASCVFRLLSFHCSAYSVYFCTVPLAVSSLLGIQRLLLYRSACCLFTAWHTASTSVPFRLQPFHCSATASASVPFRCCLRRHAASTARPSLRAKKKGPCGKAGIENRIKGRNRNGSEELRRSSSSPRSISIAQLSTLLRLHLRPIKLVVSK